MQLASMPDTEEEHVEAIGEKRPRPVVSGRPIVGTDTKNGGGWLSLGTKARNNTGTLPIRKRLN